MKHPQIREIKFRAWDKVKSKIREVVRIDFDSADFNVMLRTPTESAPKHWALRNFKDIELMQFTGLLDKNRKEIYEGDIVGFSDGTVIGKITWNKFNAQFIMLGKTIEQSMSYTKNNYVIIGNIYENLNLLP